MTGVIIKNNLAAYNQAVAAWEKDTYDQLTSYLGSVQGKGIYSFELFYKYQKVMAWGIVLPMPWQLDFPMTSRNRDAFIANVNVFYEASLKNSLEGIAPESYVDITATDITEHPVFVVEKAKKSRWKKILKVVLIVAVIVVAAVAIAAVMAGSAAAGATAAASTAAGSATGAAGTAAAGAAGAASTAGAMTATASTAFATAAGTAVTSTATVTATTGWTVTGALKAAGTYLVKAAAGQYIGGEINQHVQEKAQEKQAATANAAAIQQQQIADIELKAAQAEQENMQRQIAEIQAETQRVTNASVQAPAIPVTAWIAIAGLAAKFLL